MIQFVISILVCLYLFVDVLAMAWSESIEHPQCTEAYMKLNLHKCVLNPETFDTLLKLYPESYKCKIDHIMYQITSKIQCSNRHLIFKALKYDVISNPTEKTTNIYNRTTVVLKITNLIDIKDCQNFYKSMKNFGKFLNEVKSREMISSIEQRLDYNDNETSPSQHVLPILDYAPKLHDNISIVDLLHDQIRKLRNSIIVLKYIPLEVLDFLQTQKSLPEFTIVNSDDVFELQSRQIFKQFKQNPVKYTAQFINDMSIVMHATNVEANWVHRDIKLENVFIDIIDTSNMSDIKVRFVLGDWEMATPINKMIASASEHKKIIAGTIFMISPEIGQLEVLCQQGANLTSTQTLINFGVNINMSSLATSIDAYSTVCLYVFGF